VGPNGSVWLPVAAFLDLQARLAPLPVLHTTILRPVNRPLPCYILYPIPHGKTEKVRLESQEKNGPRGEKGPLTFCNFHGDPACPSPHP
jgi:hypothetical protein